MSASTDLTTLAKVKSYLGLSASDHDALLESLIDAASEAVEHYCRREFASRERTEYHDGLGAQGLVLGCRPVASVASVHDDPARVWGAETLVDPDDYTFYPNAGLLQRDAGRFADGTRNVKVVYTAGYASIPPAVEQAANVLVAHFFNRGAQRGDGVTNEHAGSYAVTYEIADWPAAVRGLLAEYR